MKTKLKRNKVLVYNKTGTTVVSENNFDIIAAEVASEADAPPMPTKVLCCYYADYNQYTGIALVKVTLSEQGNTFVCIEEAVLLNTSDFIGEPFVGNAYGLIETANNFFNALEDAIEYLNLEMAKHASTVREETNALGHNINALREVEERHVTK